MLCDGPRTGGHRGTGITLGPQDMSLVAPSAEKMPTRRNRNFRPPTRDEPLVGHARKDPLIRRAVSTLVYATLLRPAQKDVSEAAALKSIAPYASTMPLSVSVCRVSGMCTTTGQPQPAARS